MRRTRAPRTHRFRNRFTALLALFFLLYLGWSWIAMPASALKGASSTPTNSSLQALDPNLAWPASGQAAIGTSGHGTLKTFGTQSSAPIASIAKTMLALAILREKPITGDGQGDTITLTQADVDSYNTWVAKHGSVAMVQAGEEISEYQALQALLLPSANNMADSLAVWGFGSIDAYADYANNYAAQLGLHETHFVDASGFDPGTVSSARDLIVIGQKALANPVISDIVDQTSAVLPVAGTVRNVNGLLGKNGVVGIKTGNTDQAGGCLLFAATQTVGQNKVTVVGAVLGAANLAQSMQVAHDLLVSAQQNFADAILIHKNATVATYQLPWGETVKVRADDNLHVTTWANGDARSSVALSPVKLPLRKNQVVGKAVGTSLATNATSSIPVVVQTDVHGPSFWWRLFHPDDTWRLRFAH